MAKLPNNTLWVIACTFLELDSFPHPIKYKIRTLFVHCEENLLMCFSVLLSAILKALKIVKFIQQYSAMFSDSSLRLDFKNEYILVIF